MTYFTEGSIQGDQNLYDIESSLGAFSGASFDSAIDTNPLPSTLRLDELTDAELGNRVGETIRSPTGLIMRLPKREEPDSPLLSKEDAQSRVTETGLNIEVPAEGIRSRALDIIIERHRVQRERQIIENSAPPGILSGAAGLAAGLAASILDPINLSSAFIPVVGPGRYARSIAAAKTSLGRAGVRARVGAIDGAVGAAVIEPLPLLAAEQDQTDYTIADSMLNIAFGGILGGGLHVGAGAWSDRLNVSKDGDVSVKPEFKERADAPFARVDLPDRTPAVPKFDQEQFKQKFLDDLKTELGPVTRPDYKIPDLKKEAADIEARLESIESEFTGRAKAFQKEKNPKNGKPNTRKQAERAARDSITEDISNLTERKSEVESFIDENRRAQISISDRALVEKGEVPEQFKKRFEEELNQAQAAFTPTPLATGVKTAAQQVSEAPFQVREAAFKGAIAQAVTGRPVDVEHIVKGTQQKSAVPTKEEIFTEVDDLAEIENGIELELQRLGDDAPDTSDIDLEAEAYARAFDQAAICMRSG